MGAHSNGLKTMGTRRSLLGEGWDGIKNIPEATLVIAFVHCEFLRLNYAWTAGRIHPLFPGAVLRIEP